jgi:hypothetical protein
VFIIDNRDRKTVWYKKKVSRNAKIV